MNAEIVWRLGETFQPPKSEPKARSNDKARERLVEAAWEIIVEFDHAASSPSFGK